MIKCKNKHDVKQNKMEAWFEMDGMFKIKLNLDSPHNWKPKSKLDSTFDLLK
jgi:hypothetical protein